MPWQECHDSSLRMSGDERLREFRMRARNASQNRLQSDWRESRWCFFSFNFSIRPPLRGTKTSASSILASGRLPSFPSRFNVETFYSMYPSYVCACDVYVYDRLCAVILCVDVTGLPMNSCHGCVLDIVAFNLPFICIHIQLSEEPRAIFRCILGLGQTRRFVINIHAFVPGRCM